MKLRSFAATAAIVLMTVSAAVPQSFAATVVKNTNSSASGPSEVAASTLVPESFPQSFAPRAKASKSDGYYFNGSGMYTYEMLEEDLNALRNSFGITVDSIAKTADGREVFHAVLGNAGASKKILVVASTHGREYMTTPLVMRQVKDLLDRKAGGDTSLDSVCIHVVPMFAPDGCALSQYGVQGLKTQQMRNKVDSILESWSEWQLLTDVNKYIWYLNKWKNNGSGVDLNRNFNTARWAELDDLRNKPSNDLYKGPSPESEPETKGLVQLAEKEHFDEVLSYHAQGQVIYWYVPSASEEVNARNRVLAELVRLDTGYSAVAEESSGTGIGSMKTWFNVNLSTPCITIETGLGTCPLPESDLEGIWQKNKTVLYDAMTELRLGWQEYAIGKGYIKAETPAETAAETAADSGAGTETAGNGGESGTSGTAGPGAGPGISGTSENEGPGAAGPGVSSGSAGNTEEASTEPETAGNDAGPSVTSEASEETASAEAGVSPSGTDASGSAGDDAPKGGISFVEAIPGSAP